MPTIVANGRKCEASMIDSEIRWRLTVPSIKDRSVSNLKADVAEVLRALDEGRFSPFDEATLERIKNAGRFKLESEKNKKLNSG
jgi:hypothetical protein